MRSGWQRSCGMLMALLGVLLCTSGAAAQGLVWQFEKGDRFEYRTTLEQTQSMAGAGVAVSTRAKVTLTHRFEVVSVDEDSGAARIRVTADRVVAEGEARALGIGDRYDSKRDRSAPASLKPFEVLAKGEFELTVLPNGKITDAGELAALMQEASAQMDVGGMTLFGSMLAPGAARALLESGFGVLPEKPEEAGSAWTENTSIPLAGMGSLTTSVAYHEQRARRRGDRRFAFEGDFDFTPGAKPAVTIRDGLLEGAFVFSERIGRLRDLEHAVRIEAEITGGGMNPGGGGGAGGGGNGGGTAARVTLDQRTRIELID